MSDEIVLCGVSATIEATQRGFMVWVRDGSGRTIGQEHFHVVCRCGGDLDAATDSAYAAAAAYADCINSR